MTSRAEVRAYGRKVEGGDLFTNRYQEHEAYPRSRVIEIVKDVPRLPLFAFVTVRHDTNRSRIGKTGVIRTRTLMTRWVLISHKEED